MLSAVKPRRRITGPDIVWLLFIGAAAAGMTWFGIFGLYMSAADGGPRTWSYVELAAAAGMLGCALAFLWTRERAFLPLATAALVVPPLHVFLS